MSTSSSLKTKKAREGSVELFKIWKTSTQKTKAHIQKTPMMKVLRKHNLPRLVGDAIARLCDERKLVKSLVAHLIKVLSIETRRVRSRFEELKLLKSSLGQSLPRIRNL